MIKISKLTDYAVLMLFHMSRQNEQTVLAAQDVADMSGLPLPTVSKILKILAKSRIVSSTRGVKGGYKLDHDLSRLTVVDVIVAMDGPIKITSCADGGMDDCDMAKTCPMAGRWTPVNQAINTALGAVTLDAMFANDVNYKVLNIERAVNL